MYRIYSEVYQYEDIIKDDNSEVLGAIIEKWELCDQWYESTVEMWEERLKEKYGVTGAKISFSGFWSQGDGASFTGKIDDVDKWLKHSSVKVRFGLSEHIYGGKITRVCSRYSHENTVSTNLESNGGLNDYPNVSDYIDTVCAELDEEDLLQDICREIYKDLKADYEYQTSKAAILESIAANEYEFTQDGEMV